MSEASGDELHHEYHRGEPPPDDSSRVDDSIRYAAPEIALGHDLGQASAHGSPKARRMAKVMAWIVILAIVLPVAYGLLVAITG